MKINDLIFRELVKRGYKLEGKTRVWDVADSKLWYLQPEQAQGYLDLENAPAYKKSVTDKETNWILKNLPYISKFLSHKEYNIVDLGCGDGKKAAIFIKNLPANLKIRYCPVDISGYMIKKAIKNVRSIKNIPIVEFNWNISDFENLPNLTSVLSESYYKHNFLLLLGDTFCNFNSDDILSNIKSSMKKDDLLLLGNNLLLNDIGKNVEPYKNNYLNKFLLKVVEQIGLNKNDVVYGARFNIDKIEMYFDVIKNKTIKHNNKNVSFQSGDRIIVAYSHRYLFNTIKEKIEKYFKNTKYFTNTEKDYVLTLSIYK